MRNSGRWAKIKKCILHDKKKIAKKISLNLIKFEKELSRRIILSGSSIIRFLSIRFPADIIDYLLKPWCFVIIAAVMTVCIFTTKDNYSIQSELGNGKFTRHLRNLPTRN